MDLYLSRDMLLFAVNNFKLLANGEDVKQGVTQDISAIRHCLALSRLLNKEAITSVKLKHKTDPYLDDFISYVGDVVKLDQDGVYTTNLINDIKHKSDFGVGSNLLSTGVATHSTQSIQIYPKKSNKGLLVIDDYQFSLADDYLNKLKDKYGFSKVGFSFLIWLNRFNKFDESEREPRALFGKLVEHVRQEYPADLANLIAYSDSNDFVEYSKNFNSLLTENEVELASLFELKPQANETILRSSNLTSIAVLYKPFLLLAGISGTGKSRFVREQAKRSSGEEEPSNYELISVRPDWHEPSDLLGYVSRLGENAPYFVSTPTLKFMVSAWKNINPTEEALSTNRFEDKSVLPYWLCLDEMNLAPVEQYFADYLSVIETREWIDDGYRCDSILKADVIKGLSDKGRDALKKDLGLETGFDALWDYFCAQGVPIPYNLIVAGTVNMDETTHGFSRKVIDRALTVDFGEFFPNDFDAFFDESQKQPIVLSYPTGSEARKATDTAIKSRQFLKDLNESALKGTAFEVAFRALNELLLSVQSFAPYSDDDSAKLQAVWDDFLMMKVLPRIEGDRDKVEQVLDKLKTKLESQLNDIWSEEPKRPDLWRDTQELIPCRSKVKIKWMQGRLDKSGFTSFWP